MGKIRNEAKYKQAIEEFQADPTTTVQYLSQKYAFDRASFSRYMKKMGISIPRCGRSTETQRIQQVALQMYIDGMSMLKISKELGISRKSFGLCVHKAGIDIRDKKIRAKPSYSVNHNYFDHIKTENQAYWLGFLFADGSVRLDGGSYRLSLEISSVDRCHLEKFLTDIESDVEIKSRRNGRMVSVLICSKHLVQRLMQLGCVPNKTREGFLDSDTICDSLIPAFLRGYFDGDGYIDKKRYRIVYTVHSCSLMNYLHNALLGLGLDFDVKQEKTGYYRIKTERKQEYVDFLKKIFGSASIYLDRKYAIYEAKIAVLGRNS